jgi:hypothetical protein
MKIGRSKTFFPILNLLFSFPINIFGLSLLGSVAQAKQTTNALHSSHSKSLSSGAPSDKRNHQIDNRTIKRRAVEYLQTKRRQILPIESQSGVNSLPDR